MAKDNAGHMDEDDEFPFIPSDLLDALSSKLPEYIPQPGVPPEKYWYEIGRRSVLQYLRQESLNQRKR